jgi:hypothetical protein
MARTSLLATLLAVAMVACSGAPGASPEPTGQAGPASPEPTGQAGPASYEEFAEGFCLAMSAMVRAIGNPDTGADSDLSFGLEQAIERGDLAAANEAAGKMAAELLAARHEATRISAWTEGAETAKHLDRFLAASEIYVEAFLGAAPQGLEAAQAAAQQASQDEDALSAWIGMLDGVGGLATTSERRALIDCRIPADPRNPEQ